MPRPPFADAETEPPGSHSCPGPPGSGRATPRPGARVRARLTAPQRDLLILTWKWGRGHPRGRHTGRREQGQAGRPPTGCPAWWEDRRRGFSDAPLRTQQVPVEGPQLAALRVRGSGVTGRILTASERHSALSTQGVRWTEYKVNRSRNNRVHSAVKAWRRPSQQKGAGESLLGGRLGVRRVCQESR